MKCLHNHLPLSYNTATTTNMQFRYVSSSSETAFQVSMTEHFKCSDEFKYGSLFKLKRLPYWKISVQNISSTSSINNLKYTIDGNGFADSFLNQDVLADPTVIPHSAVLQANIAQRLGVNHMPLQHFLVVSYDDEFHEHTARHLEVQALNVSQIHYICQVLLRRDLFYHNTELCRRKTVFIGLAGTVKTQTIMSLIVWTYFML